MTAHYTPLLSTANASGRTGKSGHESSPGQSLHAGPGSGGRTGHARRPGRSPPAFPARDLDLGLVAHRQASGPVLTIRSGETVHIDTLSHAGIMSDTEPVEYRREQPGSSGGAATTAPLQWVACAHRVRPSGRAARCPRRVRTRRHGRAGASRACRGRARIPGGRRYRSVGSSGRASPLTCSLTLFLSVDVTVQWATR